MANDANLLPLMLSCINFELNRIFQRTPSWMMMLVCLFMLLPLMMLQLMLMTMKVWRWLWWRLWKFDVMMMMLMTAMTRWWLRRRWYGDDDDDDDNFEDDDADDNFDNDNDYDDDTDNRYLCQKSYLYLQSWCTSCRPISCIKWDDLSSQISVADAHFSTTVDVTSPSPHQRLFSVPGTGVWWIGQEIWQALTTPPTTLLLWNLKVFSLGQRLTSGLESVKLGGCGRIPVIVRLFCSSRSNCVTRIIQIYALRSSPV